MLTREQVAFLQANAAPAQPTQGRARFVNGQFVLDDDKPQQQKKKKGFWQDQISTGGGIGGALGGAAAGAAVGSVVPVVGTAVGGLLGAVLGGGLGSAGGEIVENNLTGDEWNKNVLQEGLIGGATSLPITAGLKLARAGVKAGTGLGGRAAGELVQEAGMQSVGRGTVARGGRFGTTFDDQAQAALGRLQGGGTAGIAKQGGKLEQLGGRMLASQAQVTGSQARRAGIKPVEVLGSINARTGLTNLDDMAEVSRGLTGAGDDSLLDTLTRSAVESTSGVDVPDLRALSNSLLDSKGTLLTDAQRKTVLRNVKNASVAMRGGSQGSLSTLANPNEALNQANAFRSAAQTIKTSSLTASPEQKQLAGIYDDLARSIEDAIYKAPGVNDSLPMLVKAGADDLLFRAQDLRAAGQTAQAQAYEKIAKELRGVKSVKDLRSIKRDFVDLGKIDDFTAQAEGARAFNSEDAVSLMRRNPITGTIGAALNAGMPRAAGRVAQAGRALQGGSGQAAGRTVGVGLMGTTVRQATGRALTGGQGGEMPADTPMDLEAALAASQGAMEQQAMPVQTPFGYSSQELGQAMGAAMMNGDDEAFKQLKQMYDMTVDAEGAGGLNLGATARRQMTAAANGEEALNQMEAALAQAGGGSGTLGKLRGVLPGELDPSAKYYNDSLQGYVPAILQALGKTDAPSETELRGIIQAMPQITDTPEVAAQKLESLRTRIRIAQQNSLRFGGGNDQALTAQAGSAF